ncbi:MAG: hypothetical protein ACLFNN_00185 [Candidatus Paceibacterota bacterium]
MSRDDKKKKKSFWEEFFGIPDDEEDLHSDQEGTRIPIRNEEEDIMNVLEGGRSKDKRSFEERDDEEKVVETEERGEEIEDTEEVETEKDHIEDERGDHEQEDLINEDTEEGSKEKKITPVRADADELPKAPQGQRFFIHEGPSLGDLYDLHYYLDTITENQLNHHVNEDRNDFACWVRDVLGERELASKLEAASGREEMRDILSVYINLK